MSRRLTVLRRRLMAGVALSVVALTGAGLTVTSSAPRATAAIATAATSTPPAPSLLTPVSGSREVSGARRGVQGQHRLVTLDPEVLPTRALGQRLRLPSARGAVSVVRVNQVEHEPAYTAWTGGLEGQEFGSFTLVEADGVYRGSLISPEGSYSLTRAEGERYWWTKAQPQTAQPGDDAVTLPAPRSVAPAIEDPADAKPGRKGKAKISVMFAFTKAVRAEAGGRAELKAAAALAISQTNETFRNSGLKVKMRYKGMAKAKGRESRVAVKDLFRLYRPRDGHFDNLARARRRHHADLVHLFTAGSPYDVCGAGLIPLSPRRTHRSLGWSTSFLSCMPYLVATHEFGHNLGADHGSYAGISHDSKLPYAYAFHNVAGNYFSVMGYYAPCEDQQIYTCVRVPWFSSPANTYGEQPLGSGTSTNNTRVVRKIAPRVARYVR